jgi:hypothetical protein
MNKYCKEYCIKADSYVCCYYCQSNKYCIEQCEEIDNNIIYENCKNKKENKK